MIPIEHNEPTNAKILAISEDKIEGFVREPFEEIAKRSDVPVETVMERIAAMLRAGTIRRVRQTLLATNLAEGALVAWKVAPEKIDAAFDFMFQRDPFSGHVVLRSTDTVTRGLGLQTLDDSESAARLFVGGTLRAAGGPSRRGSFPTYAGERNFHTRRRTCSAKNDCAGKQGRCTGKDVAGASGDVERSRMGCAHRTETRIHAGRNSAQRHGKRAQRKPGFRWMNFIEQQKR